MLRTRRLRRPCHKVLQRYLSAWSIAWSVEPTSSAGRSADADAAADAEIDCHRYSRTAPTRRLRRPPPRYRKGWPSTTPLQADLSPEVSASLVALARRSQPGRKGPVKSRIPKTLKCLNHEIWDLTGPFRSGSLVVDRATREVETDPSTDPHPAGTHAFGPGPFPSEPGPPEAYQ